MAFTLDIHDLVIRDKNGKVIDQEVTLVTPLSPFSRGCGTLHVELPCGFCKDGTDLYPLYAGKAERFHHLSSLTTVCDGCSSRCEE